jgi:hypothetical protein
MIFSVAPKQHIAGEAAQLANHRLLGSFALCDNRSQLLDPRGKA